MKPIQLDEDLLSRAREAAQREGFGTVDEFVAAAVTEWVMRPQRRRFLELAGQLRERVVEGGLTEGELLADFDQWRDAGSPDNQPE
jgi:hypothetical protein